METVGSLAEINDYSAKSEMLLVYFGGRSCGVCRNIMPKLEKMLEKYPGIKAVKVETESSEELSASFQVFTVPVVILFVLGKETIREAGIISLIELEGKISRYYEMFHSDN